MKLRFGLMAMLAALCWGSLGAALSAELVKIPFVDAGNTGRSVTAETDARRFDAEGLDGAWAFGHALVRGTSARASPLVTPLFAPAGEGGRSPARTSGA